MRFKDAIASLQLGRKKEAVIQQLRTVWTEEADDGPRAVPLPEHPMPQMRRADWTCLNGWWDYGICPAGKGLQASLGEADGKILVPFSPETMRSGAGRTLHPGEILWYRRTIDDIERKEGRRILLHFGAVDERCAVYWNGRKAGTHRNGYLAFTLDVTEFVRPGTNELKVLVRDDTDEGHECRGKQTLSPGGMFYHAQSGIWQTVWMETVPECYLKDLKITPLPAEEAVEMELSFSCEPPEGREVRVTVDGSCYAFALEPRMKVRVPVPRPRLWSPEHPALYSLRIETGTGEETDAVESYFAMRSFGVGTDGAGRPRLLLNGEPYFFNGILDQGYWPETLMTPPADEALVYDIEQMKDLGFNMLRKHVKIEPARWYYHCDRLGMVVWQDMVNGGGPVPRLLETYLPTVFPAVGKHLRDGPPHGPAAVQLPVCGHVGPLQRGMGAVRRAAHYGQYQRRRPDKAGRSRERMVRPGRRGCAQRAQLFPAARGGGRHPFGRARADPPGQGVRDLRIRRDQLPDRGAFHERRGLRIQQCDERGVPRGVPGDHGEDPRAF